MDKMSFLFRAACLSLRDRIKSSTELEVAPSLPEKPVELARASGLYASLRRSFKPGGDRGEGPGHWRDYVPRLILEHIRIPPEELEDVAGLRKVCASLDFVTAGVLCCLGP